MGPQAPDEEEEEAIDDQRRLYYRQPQQQPPNRPPVLQQPLHYRQPQQQPPNRPPAPQQPLHYRQSQQQPPNRPPVPQQQWYWMDSDGQSRGPFTSNQMIQIRIDESFSGSTRIRHCERESFVSLWKYFPDVPNPFSVPHRIERNMIYQKTGTTMIAFSKAIDDDRWRRLFRSMVPKMTDMGWRASRALNHFVINCVFTDAFNINCTNALKAVVRMCYTVNRPGDLVGSLEEDNVCVQWYKI